MGFGYMYGAYTVAWVVIFAYMLILGKGTQSLKRKLSF
jgi:CcmD family protein